MTSGVPQVSVLSPPVLMVYLNYLDENVEGGISKFAFVNLTLKWPVV